MPATYNQPVGYIDPTDSSIDTNDNVVITGASQGPPSIWIKQVDPITIEVTPWVA